MVCGELPPEILLRGEASGTVFVVPIWWKLFGMAATTADDEVDGQE